MNTLTCGRCGAVRDQADNFCRRCGRQLTVNLPAVRPTSLPARSSAVPASLVGSVAVLALGTGLEWLTRRLAGSAARAAGRALIGQDRHPVPSAKPRSDKPDVSVDEIIYVHKVELRSGRQ